MCLSAPVELFAKRAESLASAQSVVSSRRMEGRSSLRRFYWSFFKEAAAVAAAGCSTKARRGGTNGARGGRSELILRPTPSRGVLISRTKMVSQLIKGPRAQEVTMHTTNMCARARVRLHAQPDRLFGGLQRAWKFCGVFEIAGWENGSREEEEEEARSLVKKKSLRR